MQVRGRYVEVFNVMLYAAFMLREALALTQGRYEEMRGTWNRMVSDLAAARVALQDEREARAAEAAEHARWREEAEAERDALSAEVADLRFQCKVCLSCRTMLGHFDAGSRRAIVVSGACRCWSPLWRRSAKHSADSLSCATSPRIGSSRVCRAR